VSFRALVANYAGLSGVLAVQAAVCEADGATVLFVDKAAPMAETASVRLPDHAPVEAFDAVPVACLSLASLWDKHVAGHLNASVDILHIDAEKMEHAIVTATDFDALEPRPKHILYESIHLTDFEKVDIRRHLASYGYDRFLPWAGCGEAEMDTLASYRTVDYQGLP